MPITFVASGAASSSSNAISPDLPSGWAEDDVHILLFNTWAGNSEPSTTLTGWTLVGQMSTGTGSTDELTLTVWYRVAVAGDAAVDLSDSGNYNHGQIHGFRGVDTTTPLGGWTPVETIDTGNSEALSLTGITTDVDGAMVLYAAGHGDDGASWSSIGGHNLASFTDLYNSVTTGHDSSNHLGYGILTSAGASGTLTATIASSEETGAVCFALNPAAAAGGFQAAWAIHANTII